MDNSDRNAFDRLVAGLSSEERANMLARLNPPDMTSVEFPESSKEIDNFDGTLVTRLNKEPFFYRIVLWFRSVFSKNPVQKIYNSDVLLSLAKKVNREHPGLIDVRANVLDNLFYEELANLKVAADFFKPYFYKIDEDPGSFYVFLGSFVAPQINEEINSKVDPYKLPVSEEPTIDMRNSLMRTLDDILKNISGNSKTAMYSGVKSVQWLRSFVNLPFTHLLAQFTDIKSDSFTCPYSNAKIDYDTFAAVFDDRMSVSNEILQAIFLFSQKNDLGTQQYTDTDIEQSVKKFMAVATEHFSTIKLFLTAIPLNTIGKIIFEDYDWIPQQIGGGEDWFSKFRSQWRKIFEIRWTGFVRDVKKSLLAGKLKSDFNLLSFPESPLTQWKSLWRDSPIKYEMTSGFLNWYCEERYSGAKKIITTLLMEGVFIKNENRTEFAEAVDILDTAATEMSNFITKISNRGEYGTVFADLDGHSLRTHNAQTTLENTIAKVEQEMKYITDKFCKSIRIMEVIFKGIFDEGDGYHASIQNLNLLRGVKAKKLKDELVVVRHDLNQLLFYLTELEPIDAVD